ncbi:MAG: hypothetical protein LW595_05575, partial [Rickettsiales bacterium]|nr:hypothetical protein [Rickettsiales bacterium]
FITELGFEDDIHKQYLAIKIIEKNPKIIKDLKNLQELSTFITELDFKDNNHKKALVIKIIEKNPNIIKDSKELSKWINLPNKRLSSPYTKKIQFSSIPNKNK